MHAYGTPEGKVRLDLTDEAGAIIDLNAHQGESLLKQLPVALWEANNSRLNQLSLIPSNGEAA